MKLIYKYPLKSSIILSECLFEFSNFSFCSASNTVLLIDFEYNDFYTNHTLLISWRMLSMVGMFEYLEIGMHFSYLKFFLIFYFHFFVNLNIYILGTTYFITYVIGMFPKNLGLPKNFRNIYILWQLTFIQVTYI